MSRPAFGCPVWNFRPRVHFHNELLMPASLFGIQVPPGLSDAVPAPIYVSVEEMMRLSRSGSSGGTTGGGLGIVHGRVTSDFSIRFASLQEQWVPVTPDGAPGRATAGPRGPGSFAAPAGGARWWQFRGGDVHLELKLGLYLLEMVRPDPADDLSVQIFAVVVEHELLHVADEIDVLTRWLPSEAYRDDMVRRYLSEARPVDDSMFQHWFRGSGFQRWIEHTWAQEHNRRAALRDSPAEYAVVRRRLEELESRRINRPRSPRGATP